MHFTNKQALQPARHAAGAQGCLCCSPPGHSGEEGRVCIVSHLQGERRTVQSGSETCIPSDTSLWPHFSLFSSSLWFQMQKLRIHLKLDQVTGTSRSGWVGSGFLLKAGVFTDHIPHAAEQEAGCCFYNDWRKILSLCQVKLNSFAAGMHWYNCACC